jgi:RNA polymerase sigma-70 factor (ECF subfamily)
VSSQDFQEQLVSLMPKLRIWALALTRNRSAADDLVQDVATKALAASASFEAGTNFGAWMHRIMVNRFITGVRSRRECVAMEAIPDVAVSATHEDRTALRELGWAVNRLPPEQKVALLMIALEEKSYETASEVLGCAVGTLKSRVHRARQQLRAFMAGDPKMAA